MITSTFNNNNYYNYDKKTKQLGKFSIKSSNS